MFECWFDGKNERMGNLFVGCHFTGRIEGLDQELKDDRTERFVSPDDLQHNERCESIFHDSK